MNTVEIRKERWAAFLENVNRRLAERPVTVEVESPEIGDQEADTKVPMRGITFEKKGSQAGDVLLLLGPDSEPSSHRIEKPEKMYLAVNDDWQFDCIEFEGPGGEKTLVTFEQLLALPEVREQFGEAGAQPASP